MGVALVALVLWKAKSNLSPNGVPVTQSQDPMDDTGSGPGWLTYNQPFGYNPALGGVGYAVMPTRSIGSVGQVGDFGAQTNFQLDAGVLKCNYMSSC